MRDSTSIISLDGPVLTPEEGLLLGNGDLCVSLYQSAGQLRFRLGKGDVWDRRFDFSDDPCPVHIDEIARGLLKEKWTCGPYGGPVRATKPRDPRRVAEICQGVPPSNRLRPFPCPKPLGEFIVHYCPDLPGLRLQQTLDLDRALLRVRLSWSNDVQLTVEAFVAPETNILCIDWRLRGWNDGAAYGAVYEGLPTPRPVWFSLHRWADPGVEDFAADYFGASRHPGFQYLRDARCPPLERPLIVHVDGQPLIEQRFAPDAVFADGFSACIAAWGKGLDLAAAPGARVQLLPRETARAGALCIAAATTPSSAHPARLARKLCRHDNSALRKTSRAAARRFWSQSKLRCADAVIEKLWRALLHAKRCIYRADALPPGLFIPSTLKDYSLWHGDWHTNYNLQSVFLGDYAANHLELGDAFFQAMEYFWPIGRRIARDHYGCRGVFIQLCGFPTHPSQDPIGCAPMGRMAYMTGWAAAHYWLRWRMTLDRRWLAEVGYPHIRDCALFYTDFVKLGDDGRYHAFPSNQGEDGFDGGTAGYRDRAQVIRFIRYALTIARAAATELSMDDELREQWAQRLDRLAPEEGSAECHRTAYRRSEDAWLSPEFMSFDGKPRPDTRQPPAFLMPGHDFNRWYPGKIAYEWMIHLRNGSFWPRRDWTALQRLLTRWIHPNGLPWGMAIANYGYIGAWTESLGMLGPIQEMMLSSWDGVVRLFPHWPMQLDASFERFRAEGGWLVSAELAGGSVRRIELTAAATGVVTLDTRMRQPRVRHGRRTVAIETRKPGVVRFSAKSNRRYVIVETPPKAE